MTTEGDEAMNPFQIANSRCGIIDYNGMVATVYSVANECLGFDEENECHERTTQDVKSHRITSSTTV